MKKLVLLLCMLSSSAVAQKMKLLSGDLQLLKGQKSYGILFTYDSMLIGVDTPEKTYLRDKERLWEEKELGKGSAFVRMWIDHRIELYEPAFRKNFGEHAKVSVDDPNAAYTLILKTKRTEGGWNAGVVNKPAELDGELWIVDSADKNNVIARIGFYKFRGLSPFGGDFEMTTRIKEAYAIAGKSLGDFLKRKSR